MRVLRGMARVAPAVTPTSIQTTCESARTPMIMHKSTHTIMHERTEWRSHDTRALEHSVHRRAFREGNGRLLAEGQSYNLNCSLI